MKKGDIILIGIYLVMSIILIVYIFNYQNSIKDNMSVQIKLDGEVIQQESLPQKERKIIPIRSKYGENFIVIHDNDVAILEADCPNQICIKDGTINKPGQILVCLPNHLTVEILGQRTDDIDIINH